MFLAFGDFDFERAWTLLAMTEMYFLENKFVSWTIESRITTSLSDFTLPALTRSQSW